MEDIIRIEIPREFISEFMLADGVRNELVVGLNAFMKKHFPEAVMKAKRFPMKFYERIMRETISYLESEFGEEFRGSFRVVFGDTKGLDAYTLMTFGETGDYAEIPAITYELLRMGDFLAPGSVKGVSNGKAVVKTVLSKENNVVLNPRYPAILSILNAIHEAGHVYFESTIPSLPYKRSLQFANNFSTKEWLAVTTALDFANDVLDVRSGYESLKSFEYLVYTRHYYLNRKFFKRFVRALMDRGFKTDLEVLDIYRFARASVLFNVNASVMMAYANSSFFESLPLNDVVERNYFLTYAFLNMDDERLESALLTEGEVKLNEKLKESLKKRIRSEKDPKKRAELEAELTRTERTIRRFWNRNRETPVFNVFGDKNNKIALFRDYRSRVLEFLDYNREKNEVKAKSSPEYAFFRDVIPPKEILLNEERVEEILNL